LRTLIPGGLLEAVVVLNFDKPKLGMCFGVFDIPNVVNLLLSSHNQNYLNTPISIELMVVKAISWDASATLLFLI
jgi:hypothetical protein